MKCAVHGEVDAIGFCRNCGKAMCAACVRPVRDVYYCEDCLAQVIGIPAPAPSAMPPAGTAAGVVGKCPRRMWPQGRDLYPFRFECRGTD